MRSLLLLLHSSFLIIVITVLPLYGAGNDKELTLSESISIALENNVSLKAARLKHTSSETEFTRISTDRASLVSLSASGLQQTYITQQLNAAASYNSTSIQLHYKKMLFNNRDTRHAVALSELDIKSAIYEKQAVRNFIICDVKMHYWRLLTLKQLQLLEKEKVERFKKILEVARAKEQYGFGAELDSRWAQVQLGLVQDDLVKTESDYSKIENEFRQILSLDNDEANLILVDSLPYAVANAKEISQERFSIEKKPEYLVAIDNVVKSKENETYAKRRWIPEFTITGSYNKNDGSSMTFNFDNNWIVSMIGALPIHTDIPTYYQNNYFTGFTCSFSIFDGHRIRETVKHEHSLYDIEMNNVVIVKNNLVTQIINDRNEIDNSVRRVESLKDVIAIASDNLDAAHIKYRNGKMSLTQLLYFETDSTDTQKKYIEALYDLNVAIENLKKDLQIERYGHE